MLYSSPYFAAVDLGSNSFHLLVARVEGGNLVTVDREKDMVQLAAGLDDAGQLSDEVKHRALACLARFGERLRDLPASQVRAVGTKTLRDAGDKGSFLRDAEAALGHPIAVISGYEEARLVYAGLCHSVQDDHHQRLVIDIGGASTEFIIGCDQKPELLESLNFGCVALTRQFLADGIHPKSLKAAYLEVRNRLEFLRKPFTRHGWDLAYGTSGTVKAIAELQAGAGAGLITREGLQPLLEELHQTGALSGGEFAKARRQVLPAGVVILAAIFDALSIERLHVADATLKEGLIFDTLGRLSHDDVRNQAVQNLQVQYRVDSEQAARVAELARFLWQGLDGPHLPGVSRTKLLDFAARLHEIGLGISHSGYHHHGLYILQHSDIAGFSRFEQQLLAQLVGAHRKKLPSHWDKLPANCETALIPILLCLRLAVILNRGRDNSWPDLSLTGGDSHWLLRLPEKSLDNQPLTAADLAQESGYWSAKGIELRVLA